MFTADDYFNITNAHILNENVNHLDERKVEPDEKLPSGKTPNEKMERKRGQHGARVMLGNPALGRHRRNDPETDSYRDRAVMMDRVKDSLDKGEDPRDDEGRKNLIKAARRPRASYERQDDRPGGLRANRTKAGGYRTLVRKEETKIQEEQYRTTASGRRVRWDENEATDNAVSDMLQKRREAAAKKAATARLAAKGNLPIRKPQQNEEFESYVENLQNEGYDLSNWTWDGIEEFYIAEAKKEFPSDKVRAKSAKHMRNFLTRPNSAVGQRSKQKSKKMDAIRSTVEVGDDPRNTMHGQDLRKIREDFDVIAEYLFVEGYADTIESAELIAENISEDWVNEILDEKYVKSMDTTGRGADHRTRFPKFKGKDGEFDPKFTQQRVKSNTKKIDPYFSGRKERKDEKRQGTGGFGA
jgi:hypothetical protein